MISLKKHLWISGIIFTLHNLEEAIGFWYLDLDFKQITRLGLSGFSMLYSIIAITIIAWIAIAWVIVNANVLHRLRLLTLFSVIFLTNAFFPHILGAVYTKSYFPALITSVLLYIPYSVWLLLHLKKEYATLRQLGKIIGVGLVIAWIFVLLLQLIANMIFNT